MRNLTTIEVINKIISREDLLECADLLSLYAKLAYQEKQRKAYIKAFNIHLTDAAFLLAPRLNWSTTVNYDDYKFIAGSEAIKCYLRFTTDTELTPVRYLKSLEELADSIKKDFSQPSGNCLNQEFIDQSIKHLNKQYSFVKKYYQVHEPTFIFFNHCHRVWNSVCVPTVN